MKSLRWIALAAGIGILLIWTTVSRKSPEGVEGAVKTPARVSREGAIRLDRETQARVGLRVEPLAAARLRPERVAYGRLEEDPGQSFVLRAPAAGVVRASPGRGWPGLGQQLGDGAAIGNVEPRLTPLDRVNLADRLAAARAEVDAIRAALAAARAAHKRARVLNADDKIVSDRAVEEAAARVRAEEARLRAATESTRLIETSLERPAVRPSPLGIERGGQVMEVMARPGEWVESGQPILRVARLDTLIARVQVPAGESAGQAVAARIVAFGHEQHPLRAESIALAPADPGSPGQVYLFRIGAGALGLRPGQAVTAHLEVRGARLQGVRIPRSAVVRYAGKTWVYLQAGQEQFARKEVALEAALPDGWFTTSLRTGERVVVQGAQTLLSEELKSQIQVGEENPA